MLADVVELKRENIGEHQGIGAETDEGRALGRPRGSNPAKVAQWRHEHEASISQTDADFGLGGVVSETSQQRRQEYLPDFKLRPAD